MAGFQKNLDDARNELLEIANKEKEGQKKKEDKKDIDKGYKTGYEDVPDDELILNREEEKMIRSNKTLPMDLFNKLVEMEERDLLRENDRAVLFGMNRMDDILNPEDYMERERLWEEMDIKETEEIILDSEEGRKYLESLDKEERERILRNREEEKKEQEEKETRKKKTEEEEQQKKQEEAARKEQEAEESKKPWREEEESAFAAMTMSELIDAVEKSDELGADPEPVYKELAKRLNISVDAARDRFENILAGEKEEAEKKEETVSFSEMTDNELIDILYNNDENGVDPEPIYEELAKRLNAPVEIVKDRYKAIRDKEKEEKAEGTEESDGLELTDEMIKELADFAGMSVEDYKKQEGLVSTEDKERIREEKRKAEEAKKAEEEEAKIKKAEQDRKEEEERKQQEEEEIRKIEEEFEKLEREALEKEAEAKEILPQHEAEPQRVEGIRFELQTTNNCWCCCGTFIFNQFNGLNKIKGKGLKVYN
ncbi:MAG: hypothetical protein K6E34_07645 [Lachnospiraceae bacterium]|nr:hypothetical protein [Lachnospiraceae bacterium]